MASKRRRGRAGCRPQGPRGHGRRDRPETIQFSNGLRCAGRLLAKRNRRRPRQPTHTHTHTGGRSLGNALLSAAYRWICGGIVKRCRSDGKASVAQQQQGVPVGQAVLAWLECCQQQDPANNNRSLGNALQMTYEARGKALSNDRRSFAGLAAQANRPSLTRRCQ